MTESVSAIPLPCLWMSYRAPLRAHLTKPAKSLCASLEVTLIMHIPPAKRIFTYEVK